MQLRNVDITPMDWVIQAETREQLLGIIRTLRDESCLERYFRSRGLDPEYRGFTKKQAGSQNDRENYKQQ